MSRNCPEKIPCLSVYQSCAIRCDLLGLDVPDHLGILLDTTIGSEETHAGDCENGLVQPSLLVLEGFINGIVSLDVCFKVGRSQPVVVVDDSVGQSRELIRMTEHTTVDGIKDLLETFVNQDTFVGMLVTDVFNIFGKVTEQEDVVFANLSGDFDVGTIAGTDDETTVKNKLHVGSTRGLGTGSRDVLTDIRGRCDDLTLGNVVVLDEDDLQGITNLRVIVDNSANLVDKVNNALGHPVTRSSLATEDRNSRLHLLSLLWRHSLQSEITVDDTEDVELLTLVLVNTLDLNVKQGCRVDFYAGSLLDVVGKAGLVGKLDVLESFAELLVIGIVLDLVQKGKVLQEVIATKLRGNEFGQLRIGLVQPTARSDTVGDIGELVLTIDLDKVLENGCLDEVGVQFCYTVDLVRTNDGKESHADHLGVRFFNDRNTREHIAILGEGTLNVLQEVQVDLVDDLEVARKQVLDQWDGPFLESLCHDGVVGVTESVGYNAPGSVPIKTFVIDQDTLQLWNGKSRVGVVELDSDLVGELLPSLL
jgi:hypothetical protein